jgi:malate dehydrogenase (oxaloacetate-decarboxylating)(NADP+)
MLDRIFETVRANPRRTAFAEGEDEKSIRAAISYRNAGYGTPVLIGREKSIDETMKGMGLTQSAKELGLEILNARLSKDNKRYVEHLYGRLRRQGFLMRDCQRLINQDRNAFAATMVAVGDVDAMVTGTTRSYYQALDDVRRVIDVEKGKRCIGVSIMMTKERTVFVADATVTELPTARDMAEIAIAAAAAARRLGHEPRVALTSFTNFGNPHREKGSQVREAVQELERMSEGGRTLDFEFDGEMGPDVALDYDMMRSLYPFCRLTGPANVLVMLGPILIGLSKPAQIVQIGAPVGEIVNMAALAAYQSIVR